MYFMKSFLIVILFSLMSSCSTIIINKKNRTIASKALGNCEDAFSRDKIEKSNIEEARVYSWLLKPESIYTVHIKNDSFLKKVTFLEARYNNNDEILIDFTDLKDGKKITYKSHEIFSIGKIGKNEKKLRKVNNVISLPIVASEMSKIVFKPYKKLVSHKSIEVVGGVLTNKALGGNILNNTIKFDDSMEGLGFIKPESTRIIINDKPILPNIAGPFSLKFPAYNVWTRESKKVIAMNPIFWKTNVIRNESVLAHERVHAILHRTYNSQAFINRSSAFQEAFADFSAAHFLNDPQIGMDAQKPGVAIRDISKRTSSNKKTIDKITKVSGSSYHDDSLLISNLLWRAREVLGVEKTSEILRPIIEDLNNYRWSSLNYELLYLPKVEGKRQRFINDFEFFLAVLQKRGREDSSLSALKDLVDDSVKELSLDAQKIQNLSLSLITPLTHQSFEFSSKNEMKQSIMVGVYGTVGLVVKGYFLYEVLIDDD